MATHFADKLQVSYTWSMSLVPEPKILDNTQLCFQTAVCAYMLYQASNLISDGSEYLLLVPSLAGLVGSIVLPILGAVPDGMMVLFSATGTDIAVMQESLKVGVGALAGSTVMLLTLPWFICIMYGRAPLVDGKAKYEELKGDHAKKISDYPKSDTGITVGKDVASAAMIMIITSFIFLVIQIPALMKEGLFPEAVANPVGNATTATGIIEDQAKYESTFAFIGFILSIVFFIGYLVVCYVQANEDQQLSKIIEAIQDGTISVGAALAFMKATPGISESLLAENSPERKRLAKILRPFFAQYDTNNDGTISLAEFRVCLMNLGENSEAAQSIFDKADTNHDGSISFEEFTKHLGLYLTNKEMFDRVPDKRCTLMASYGIDDEEEEEMPEELHHLTPEEQQRRILQRAFGMMGLGTAMVLVFSDPMVDILGEIGKRVGVSPFYISFVLAPLASNASELLAAYNYAIKQTTRSLTTSLSTLVGAGCMNNTFCTSIFFFMVWKQGLAWQFTAETISMMLVQWVVGGVAYFRKTQTYSMAFLIIACYPLSLFIVWFLENMLLMD